VFSFRAQREISKGGAGEKIPPLYLSTLIPIFFQNPASSASYRLYFHVGRHQEKKTPPGRSIIGGAGGIEG